jgi:hypothetical protein
MFIKLHISDRFQIPLIINNRKYLLIALIFPRQSINVVPVSKEA